MEYHEQILYIDGTRKDLTNASIQGNYEEKKNICLNFQINQAEANALYSIRLSMQNSNDPSPCIIGFSNPQAADNTNRVLINLSFIINYYFEMQQKLIIEICKSQTNFLLITTVGNVIGAQGCTITLPLYQNSIEILTISGSAIKGDDEMINIDASILYGTGDFFYVLKKLKLGSQTKEYFAVYKSEISSEIFKSLPISSSYLNYGNNDNPIAIDLYINNTLNGTIETTINKIKNGETSFLIGDFNMNVMVTTGVREKKTFLQYLNQNLKLNLEIAIDFTGSNKVYTTPSSLHYLSEKPNLYELAIRECGDIIAAYDSDKIFPVFGFGAAIKGKGMCHCFPLNLYDNPNISGIDSVLMTYKTSLPHLMFSGPTLFAPFLKTITDLILKDSSSFSYHIILILTDGVINDLDETIDIIVEASYLPISIIIVGIGEADFSNMVILDGDDEILKSKHSGKAAKRDIVQFVPFRECANDPIKLSRTVLEELPTQIEEYYNNLS